MSRWRAHAEEVIALVIRCGFAAGTSPADIRKQVDAAYPFGPRQYQPYKTWLKVRAELFAFHGLATEAEKAKRAKVCGSPRPNVYLAEIDAARRDGLIR